VFCKNIKGVLFILIFFQADEGKMIYFLQRKRYKSNINQSTNTSCRNL